VEVKKRGGRSMRLCHGGDCFQNSILREEKGLRSGEPKHQTGKKRKERGFSFDSEEKGEEDSAQSTTGKQQRGGKMRKKMRPRGGLA